MARVAPPLVGWWLYLMYALLAAAFIVTYAGTGVLMVVASAAAGLVGMAAFLRLGLL